MSDMPRAGASVDAPWGVFGAGHAVAAFERAIADGHLAHAFLVAGPPGVGKGTLARRLAQALVCANPGGGVPGSGERGPCLECRPCRQVEAGESPDVERIAVGGVCDEQGHNHEQDNSTRIRICQVRRLGRVASLAPFASPRRIFVVDAADDLQPEAAHALLKTLEEPPADALLVLLAADVDALLPTIRSRCQEVVLRPLPVATLETALVEHAGVEPEEAGELARLAHGRYGLAMQMLADPAVRVLRESVSADIERLLAAGDNERLDYSETLAGRWSREREAVIATLDLWREWWRGRLLAAAGVAGVNAAAPAGAAAPPGARAPGDALRALRAVQQARKHLLQNVNPQLALDAMVLDLPAPAPGR